MNGAEEKVTNSTWRNREGSEIGSNKRGKSYKMSRNFPGPESIRKKKKSTGWIK